MQTKIYQQAANCVQVLNGDARQELRDIWREMLSRINKQLPHGSGFDNGSRVNLDKSTPDKLVIDSAFHHMDENGYYCGWSNLTYTVTPSLLFGIDIRLNCHGSRLANRDRDYLVECMHHAITRDSPVSYAECRDAVRQVA